MNTTLASVSPVSRLRRALVAALCGAAALVASAVAPAPAAAQQAAAPVKLLVELPPDVKTLHCGETVDIQIVGEAADRTRVGFPGRTVEVSATFGAVEVVQAPYKFRYRTPATLPDVTNVRIRAWLKEAPEVIGETTVQVIPPAPFRRLVLQGAGSTPAGASLDVWLKGETPDGQMAEVPEATVAVRVEGPGTITFVRPGRYRFDTAPTAAGNAKIVASLLRYPTVTGTLDVLVTGGSGGAATPPGATGPAPPAAGGSSGGAAPLTPNPPAPGTAPPPAPGTQNPPAVPGATDKPKPAAEDDGDGTLWTSGALRIMAWRTRSARDADWGPKRNPPAAGQVFEAVNDGHALVMRTVRTDVAKVEIEEWGGDSKDTGVTRLEPSKDGRFRLTYDAKSKIYRLGWDIVFPDRFRQWNVVVIQTLADGKVLRDELVFRRRQAPK